MHLLIYYFPIWVLHSQNTFQDIRYFICVFFCYFAFES